ncbi:MAG TPA: hypothetical protein VMF11_15300 [Candidatus Baltobacteraceae bacterium]|nr:hypothetical protein [Candidatus Baltobacteraceae bacterium]
MYARALTFKDAAPRNASPLPAARPNLIPYCFILDDTYRVVMAGPSGREDPLAALYAADSRIDQLPGPIDRVVRALTATWRTSRPAASATAVVSHLQVTVAPLHGEEGRRIAVFVLRNDCAEN